MDHRVKTSKDVAMHLAHAKAVISSCRLAIPRLEISAEDEAFIRLRIMRMISELETIDLFASKAERKVKQRRSNAKTQTNRDRTSVGAHLGMRTDTDRTTCSAVPTAGRESGDDTAVRKLA